ncbi:hypothetical protein [Catenuloplanes atrovinosus]|uniref:Uncharacterized protein n=1 Tax=Catenuloplanes atrovinosus TaxID=137266 RepID=A0AAE4C8A2_9ACTN|nr:hypothetical protein [Catenuloplanes atrovinosus]MDR7273554.1 hypothetical protein [Catenuloplanes atrovinosus]
MNPEDTAAFRCARLLILLLIVEDDAPHGIDAERLGVYDFLAAHPLLLARAPDDPDRASLRMAGFDDRALAYASPGQRLVTAQQHLGRDLDVLLGTGMVVLGAAGRVRYRLTTKGRDAATALNAAYARSYADAARIVVRRLRRLSGRRLRQTLRECISQPHLPAKDLI